MTRTIILPAVIVAIGILAALPFRRVSETLEISSRSGVNNETQSAIRDRILERSKFPTSVEPLNLDPDTNPPDPERFLSDLTPIAADSKSQSSAGVESLPASYEEIAVPLADRDDRRNLLKADRGLKHPSTHGPTTSALTGSRWGFDRFGIPRPIESLRTAADSSESERWGTETDEEATWGLASIVTNDRRTENQGSLETNQWTQLQPLNATKSDALVMASQQNAKPLTEQRETGGDTDEAVSGNRAETVFRPVLQKVQGKSDGGEPTRRRHWIYEPTP